MYVELLRSIEGVGVFPAFSLVLFVTVFTVMLLRVGRMDRGRAAGLARLPLETPERPTASHGVQR
jgi:hypothetical protein